MPELLPFRLTRQFLNLMLPFKKEGLLQNTMVHTLRALRQNHELLVNTMDVFVKEPSLDWKVTPGGGEGRGKGWRKGRGIDHELLVNTMNVFVKETSLDWKVTHRGRKGKRKWVKEGEGVELELLLDTKVGL